MKPRKTNRIKIKHRIGLKTNIIPLPTTIPGIIKIINTNSDLSSSQILSILKKRAHILPSKKIKVKAGNRRNSNIVLITVVSNKCKNDIGTSGTGPRIQKK